MSVYPRINVSALGPRRPCNSILPGDRAQKPGIGAPLPGTDNAAPHSPQPDTSDPTPWLEVLPPS